MSDLGTSIIDLVGRPWACPSNPPETFDCWALAIEVRKRLGLFTPETVAVDNRSLRDATFFANPPEGWQMLTKPVTGAVVAFGHPAKHCGICLPRNMVIHSFSGNGQTGSVQLTRLPTLTRLYGSPTFAEWTHAANPSH